MDRIGSMKAPRMLAAAAAAVLVVAGCSGGSATPAPSAAVSAAASGAASSAPSVATTPAPTAAPSVAVSTQVPVGSCADMATVGEAVRNADHYIATAKIEATQIEAALPGASAEDAGFSLEMTMSFQKPDRTHVSTGGLFEAISIGSDTWISMFGSGQWVKSDPTDSAGSSDVFGSTFDSSGLEPLTEIPADLDLPGDSTCVVGYKVSVPPVVSGGEGNPLGQLGDAAAFVVRVDEGTGLPQSMAFILDPAKAQAGAPMSIVFTFDYDTPVDIQPPDPSTIVEGGGGIPFPSGMTIPSFELPSINP